MNGNRSDRLLREIRILIAEKQYESAMSKCDIAVEVYDRIAAGWKRYQTALLTIRDAAVQMGQTAEQTEPLLRDDVGVGFVMATKHAAEELIRLCAGSDIDEPLRELERKKAEAMQLRLQAQQLAEEKRKRETERDDEGR